MKLELTHLSAYLPYGLKIIYKAGPYYGHSEINGLDTEGFKIKGLEMWFRYEYGKPILRPLSDLKKEEFNYLYTLLRVNLGGNKRDKLINEGYGITDLPYFIFEQLLENNFDMFNIINNDLAIDINTI